MWVLLILNRNRWRQKLPMLDLTRASVVQRPESCVLTPSRNRLTNIHYGNYSGADASLYRNGER